MPGRMIVARCRSVLSLRQASQVVQYGLEEGVRRNARIGAVWAHIEGHLPTSDPEQRNNSHRPGMRSANWQWMDGRPARSWKCKLIHKKNRFKKSTSSSSRLSWMTFGTAFIFTHLALLIYLRAYNSRVCLCWTTRTYQERKVWSMYSIHVLIGMIWPCQMPLFLHNEGVRSETNWHHHQSRWAASNIEWRI